MGKAKIVHQVASCMECGKEWQGYGKYSAQKKAYAHAKSTGHRVIWETGTAGSYHFPK